MIKNCRSALRATGIALLMVSAGQSHAQASPNPGLQGATDQPDPCTGAGLAAKAAVCRASDDPARSKYNLLYADTAPATGDTLRSGEDAPSGGPAGRTPKDAPRGGLRGVAADS